MRCCIKIHWNGKYYCHNFYFPVMHYMMKVKRTWVINIRVKTAPPAHTPQVHQPRPFMKTAPPHPPPAQRAPPITLPWRRPPESLTLWPHPRPSQRNRQTRRCQLKKQCTQRPASRQSVPLPPPSYRGTGRRHSRRPSRGMRWRWWAWVMWAPTLYRAFRGLVTGKSCLAQTDSWVKVFMTC